jgi:hypothetical protein
VRAQQTALQLADALDACVASLIKPAASWPSARTTMFRIEADAVLANIDRFIARYAQVSKSLSEAASGAAADSGASVLQTYGGFGEALKQKAGATRVKMNALGKPSAPAASPTPP